MFARTFTVNLKPGEGPGYARTVDQEVVPILRKFPGFRDHITIMSTDGKQAVGISFWDRREDTDAYVRDGYADVSRALKKYIEGAPAIATYNVTNWIAQAIFALNAGA